MAFYDQWVVSKRWASRCKWEIFTFYWNCATSAAMQCRRAILHPFLCTPLHREPPEVISDKALLSWCVLQSLVHVRSNHCCQIRSINENQPQSIIFYSIAHFEVRWLSLWQSRLCEWLSLLQSQWQSTFSSALQERHFDLHLDSWPGRAHLGGGFVGSDRHDVLKRLIRPISLLCVSLISKIRIS